MYTVGAQHFGNLTSGDWMWVRKGYHSTLTNDMFGSREPYRFIMYILRSADRGDCRGIVLRYYSVLIS